MDGFIYSLKQKNGEPFVYSAVSVFAPARAKYSILYTDSAPMPRPFEKCIPDASLRRRFPLVSYTMSAAEALPARRIGWKYACNVNDLSVY